MLKLKLLLVPYASLDDYLLTVIRVRTARIS